MRPKITLALKLAVTLLLLAFVWLAANLACAIAGGIVLLGEGTFGRERSRAG